jgi:hypothetical protein
MINFRGVKSLAILLTTTACLFCAGTPVLGEKSFPTDCEDQLTERQRIECLSDQNEQIRKQLQKILEGQQNQSIFSPWVGDLANIFDLVGGVTIAAGAVLWAQNIHKKNTIKETAAILTRGSRGSICGVLAQKFEKDDDHSGNLAREVFEALKKADEDPLAKAWACYWIADENSPPYEECSSGQKVFLKIAAALFCRAIGHDHFPNGKSEPLDNEKEAQTLAKFINYYKNNKSEDELKKVELEKAFNNLFKRNNRRRKTAQALAEQDINLNDIPNLLSIIFNPELHPYEWFLNTYWSDQDSYNQYPHRSTISILADVWKNQGPVRDCLLESLFKALEEQNFSDINDVGRGLLRTLYSQIAANDADDFYGKTKPLEKLFDFIKQKIESNKSLNDTIIELIQNPKDCMEFLASHPLASNQNEGR